MKQRTTLTWIIVVICIGTSLLLERTISWGRTQAYRAESAPPPASFAASNNFLPTIHQAAGPSVQPQLEATVAALVAQNAQQATEIAYQSTYISYLFTQVPAQNRAATVDTLVDQNAYRATDVAALYLALGSPAPTTPPTPTFGPSPFPTTTPTITLPPFPTTTPFSTNVTGP